VVASLRGGTEGVRGRSKRQKANEKRRREGTSSRRRFVLSGGKYGVNVIGVKSFSWIYRGGELYPLVKPEGLREVIGFNIHLRPSLCLKARRGGGGDGHAGDSECTVAVLYQWYKFGGN